MITRPTFVRNGNNDHTKLKVVFVAFVKSSLLPFAHFVLIAYVNKIRFYKTLQTRKFHFRYKALITIDKKKHDAAIDICQFYKRKIKRCSALTKFVNAQQSSDTLLLPWQFDVNVLQLKMQRFWSFKRLILSREYCSLARVLLALCYQLHVRLLNNAIVQLI